tara:strand:- start:175 stop:477 length:303 start_codon:yes stop_codon:yes gene_type:complete
MPSRINFLKRRTTEGKRHYKAAKYPEIPLSISDIYIITTVEDRLDSLANHFYNDVDLWWIIAIANPDIVRRDSFRLKSGLEIRIPQDHFTIIEAFEEINK